MISMSFSNPIQFSSLNEFKLQEYISSCYCQKWQTGDVINFQAAADEPVSLTLHDAETNLLIATFAGTVVPTNIDDDSYSIYEIIINVSDIPKFGFYYFKIQDSEGATAISYPFNYAEEHPKTILLRYLNSENDFDIVFETGIEFFLRVEGAVHNFEPRTDSEVYFDQIRNPIQLYATPYRVFTLQIGSNIGVPVWMADLVNRAFACDDKRVNGEAYERNEGAEWEIFRVENYDLIGMAIEVCQKYNGYGSELKRSYILGDSEANAIVSNQNTLNIIK